MAFRFAKTKFGDVHGEELTGKYEGIAIFRSVPYAAPPVGELRFRDPVDPEPWSGSLDTTQFASKPMQPTQTGLSMEPWASDFYYMGTPQMSEDCLYVSITTGAKEGEKKPVFMWFHGGGLASGYYSEIEFAAEELAKKGIVVVSVGQRLNVFGYMCLPQLMEEQGGTAGNYGLKDEVKALDWVRENIAYFGGDPDNITVGGQSGGTAKSTGLATSPYALGKVKRCINQSNLAWMRDYETMESACESGRAYLENLGLDPDMTVEELRKIPAMKFYNFVKDPGFGMGVKGGLPGSMVCDGKYVKYVQAEKNMAEFAAEVDYLSGGNVGEGTVRGFGLGPVEPFKNADEFYACMQEKLGDLYDDAAFRKMWPVTDENATYMSRVLASRAFGNGWGIMGGIITNRYFGAYRAKTAPKARNWSYNFGRYLPCRPEEKGTFRDTDNLLAWHSSELWYTFHSMHEGMPACRPWEDVDFRLAEQMSSYWANFIATGDPNSGYAPCAYDLPTWPESRENWGYMTFTTEPVPSEGLDEIDKLALEVIKKEGKYTEI